MCRLALQEAESVLGNSRLSLAGQSSSSVPEAPSDLRIEPHPFMKIFGKTPRDSSAAHSIRGGHRRDGIRDARPAFPKQTPHSPTPIRVLAFFDSGQRAHRPQEPGSSAKGRHHLGTRFKNWVLSEVKAKRR